MQYDSYKVQAVLNEIGGYDHSGTRKVGVPAIFGMNFQTVSTAEKLPSSNGLQGGYVPGTNTPGPLLRRGLGYINQQLAAMVAEAARPGVARQHGDHPLGQARPVTAGSQAADEDRRRADHRRCRRRLGQAASQGARTGGHGDRRRRDRMVAIGPLAGGGGVRKALPAHALRHRQHRNGRIAHAGGFRPQAGVRRGRLGAVLRRAGQRSQPPRCVGSGSGGRRLHRRQGQDRRARRRQPGRPRRAAGRVRTGPGERRDASATRFRRRRSRRRFCSSWDSIRTR